MEVGLSHEMTWCGQLQKEIFAISQGEHRAAWVFEITGAESDGETVCGGLLADLDTLASSGLPCKGLRVLLLSRGLGGRSCVMSQEVAGDCGSVLVTTVELRCWSAERMLVRMDCK